MSYYRLCLTKNGGVAKKNQEAGSFLSYSPLFLSTVLVQTKIRLSFHIQIQFSNFKSYLNNFNLYYICCDFNHFFCDETSRDSDSTERKNRWYDKKEILNVEIASEILIKSIRPALPND